MSFLDLMQSIQVKKMLQNYVFYVINIGVPFHYLEDEYLKQI